MPIPKPEPGESEQDYIARCMSWHHHNEPDLPQDQMAARCYSTWRSNEQIAPATPGAGVKPDKWAGVDHRCICRRCGHSMEVPAGKRCRDTACPRCGGAMYRESLEVEWFVPPGYRRLIK